MRTLAIGDIHGCHTALVTLLKAAQVQPEDQVVFLGDYIDRGPATKQVIEMLLGIDKFCTPVFLRGNHELMILDARDDFTEIVFWQTNGGLEALESYGANHKGDWVSLIPDSHWKFFEQTRNYFENGSTIFVHGCADPDLDMRDQPPWILCWERFDKMLPHRSGKRVICGHTPQLFSMINNVGYAVCIDTGAAAGGWLSCLDVESNEFWQANEEGQVRSGTL